MQKMYTDNTGGHMRINICHPHELLPHIGDQIITGSFLNRCLNEKYTPRVRKYISMYNLDIGEPGFTDNAEEIPCIKKPQYAVPEKLWAFNKLKSHATPNDGAHFYVDDDVMMRFIRHPEKYMDELKKVKCVISLDLSTYQEFRLPLVRYNIYRNRLFTQELQKNGINTIPAVQWRDKKSFSFCFLGIPPGSMIAVSTIGVRANNISLSLWKEGMIEAIRQIKPEAILLYGGFVDFDFGSIEVHQLPNENIRRLRHYGR